MPLRRELRDLNVRVDTFKPQILQARINDQRVTRPSVSPEINFNTRSQILASVSPNVVGFRFDVGSNERKQI